MNSVLSTPICIGWPTTFLALQSIANLSKHFQNSLHMDLPSPVTILLKKFHFNESIFDTIKAANTCIIQMNFINMSACTYILFAVQSFLLFNQLTAYQSISIKTALTAAGYYSPLGRQTKTTIISNNL